MSGDIESLIPYPRQRRFFVSRNLHATEILVVVIWGVRSSDPVTLAGVGAGLLVATFVASMIPAARIVRLKPADTLRME